MTIKKLIIILCLIILLWAAKLAYDEHFGPASAVSQEQDEAARLEQLEADLLRAAATGRGDYKNSTSLRTSERKFQKTRRTGST